MQADAHARAGREIRHRTFLFLRGGQGRQRMLLRAVQCRLQQFFSRHRIRLARHVARQCRETGVARNGIAALRQRHSTVQWLPFVFGSSCPFGRGKRWRRFVRQHEIGVLRILPRNKFLPDFAVCRRGDGFFARFLRRGIQ